MLIHTEISPIYTIKNWLPDSINACLNRVDRETLEKISEIRLRKNGITTVTIEGKNRLLTSCGIEKDSSLSISLSSKELDEFIYKACKGSVYSHEASLDSFFITVDGIRTGLGASVDSSGRINEITSVCVRIPRHVDGCSAPIMEYFENSRFSDGKGVLIISPPGLGKTTILRDLAQKLSSFKRNKSTLEMQRVCVIDERHEVFMERIFDNCCIDFISGTDKKTGIERAVRLLSPQIIICDELSGKEEAETISRAKNNGTIFIASYHCDSFQSALGKDFLLKLFDDGVFGAICTLKRAKNGKVSAVITKFGEENA